jgi:hypothetical protein
MASHKAHHATGVAAGAMAASVVIHADASGPYHVWAALALLAGISGGTAPDWLELAWWSRRKRLWIKHRTLTHWGIAWIAALIYFYLRLGLDWYAPIAFGFACGGVMHLVADYPTPLGIPWILTRHSLNLWNSGRCDLIVVILSWLAAFFLADYLFWDLTHVLWLRDYLRSSALCK